MAKGNGTNTNQENLGFDVEAWKEQGVRQIQHLNAEIDSKDLEKRGIDNEIAVLIEQRTAIEKTLGLYKLKSGTKKVQLKPIVLQVLHENEGLIMDYDTIVEKVLAEQPKANAKKVRGAFDRFAKKDSRVKKVEGGWVFTSTPGPSRHERLEHIFEDLKKTQRKNI